MEKFTEIFVSFETPVKELHRNILSLLFLTKMLRFSEYSHHLVTGCLKAMILLQDNPLCVWPRYRKKIIKIFTPFKTTSFVLWKTF